MRTPPTTRQVAVALALVALSLTGALVGALRAVPASPSSSPTPVLASGVSPRTTHSPDTRSAGPSPSHGLVAPDSGVGRDLSPAEIFAPNPVSPTVSSVTGTVVPAYPSVPAPMGLSDFGVNATGSYTYRTSSFQGVVTIRSLAAFQPQYVSAPPYEAPNWALLQLNAVAVNISASPTGSAVGEYWVQNAVHLNGSYLQFEDNVWNFSAPNATLRPGALAGTTGQVYRSEFYAGFGALTPVSFPLTVRLYDNVTRTSGRDVVHFNYTLVPASGPAISGNYDTVTFTGSASALPAPQFEVNGSATAPAHELLDAELVFGGNGAGTNTNVVSLNATASLSEWNQTASVYRPVRAAYDFGSDSSETALGVAIHYVASGAAAYLEDGPSLLYGLWNTSNGPVAPSAAPGSIHLALSATPNYAFVFANLSATGPLYSYAPTGTLVTDLPPPASGTSYRFVAYADGYLPASVATNTSGVLTLVLTSSRATVDAPLYLDGQPQLLAFASAQVSGSAYSSVAGTLWWNATRAALAPPFLALNGVGNPEFELFAEQGLSSSVTLNGFVQDPATFNYTVYNAPVRFYPGWTQGYFFFGGTGQFRVENTTITGEPTLLGTVIPTFPVPTVEFSFTTGASVRALGVSNEAVGITAYGGSGLTASSIAVDSGGEGIVASNLTGLSVTTLTATGASEGLVLNHTGSVRIHGLTVTNSSLGLLSSSSTNVNLSSVKIDTGATGFAVNTTGPANLSSVNVLGGAASSFGTWSESVDLTIANLTSSGAGVVLQHDSFVSVENASANGIGASVVQEFSNSTFGLFATIEANSQSSGLNLSDCNHALIRDLTVTSGSAGAVVDSCGNVSGHRIVSSVSSTGVAWNVGQNGSFDQVTASDLSIGVWISNITNAVVTNVTSYNLTLGSAFYFTNPATLTLFPATGVAVYNGTNVRIVGVQSTDYPFGVWSNGTVGLSVARVQGWYGGVLIDVNASSGTSLAKNNITSVFAFGCRYGVYLQNTTWAVVSLSMFEDSSVLGLIVQNGSHNSVVQNDFVGNNGSSVSGSYSPNHVQAWTNNTSLVSFAGNYWSDHSTRSPYTVNNTIRDNNPQTVPVGIYLEFTESGLSGGQAWAIALGALPTFNTTESLFFIPGWIIPNGTQPFQVVGPLAPAPVPRYGNVSWFGATLPAIHIQFGTPTPPFTIFGVSGYIVIGAVVAVGLLGLLAYLFVFRKKRRPPARSRVFDPNAP